MTKKPKKKKPREWERFVLLSPKRQLFTSFYQYRHIENALAPGWKIIKVRIVEVVE